jgi:hypothetical protein
MADPIYFVVERRHGKEMPSIIHDVIPKYLTRKVTPFEQSPIIYIIRLDTLPNSEWWLSLSLTELYYYYKNLRNQNKLPSSNMTLKK